MDRASSCKPAFFWLVLALFAVNLIAYVLAATIIYRHGSLSQYYGWSVRDQDGVRLISDVDPQGPASKLSAGWRSPSGNQWGHEGSERALHVGNGPDENENHPFRRRLHDFGSTRNNRPPMLPSLRTSSSEMARRRASRSVIPPAEIRRTSVSPKDLR